VWVVKPSETVTTMAVYVTLGKATTVKLIALLVGPYEPALGSLQGVPAALLW
jgi:hypothetical protein